MRTLLICLVLGCLTPIHGIAGQVSGLSHIPPRDAPPRPQVGTGSIGGRVTASDTGAPLRRALVNLMGPPPSRGAYTDDEGRYTFTGLPAGTYRILATPGTHRAGYQPSAYGAAGGSVAVTRGKPIELADGQKLENIDVALPRTAVISGRVTDAGGEPAARVQVQALIVRIGGEPTMTGSASTNDLGEFRLFNLMPGDYVLMVSPQLNSAAPELEGEATGYAPSYAPGVSAIADATRIRLGRGMQATADIRLQETRVYAISGTVLTSSGQPSRGGSISVTPADSPYRSMYSTGVSGEGTFTFRNIPPGSYELISRHHLPRPPGATITPGASTQEFGSARIDVVGDMENVLISMTTGAVVTGEAVFEEPLPAGGRVNIAPTPAEMRNFSGVPAVEVSGSQFTLRGVFSPILLRGNASGGPVPWAMKAVLLRGKDITDEPTLFTASDSGHLQVVFTAKAPSIEGSVVGDDGQPALDATVIIFGHDPKTWKPRSSFTRTTRTGKDGKFLMRGLREGRYYVAAIALDAISSVAQPGAEFLEPLSAVATALTLNAGETRSLDLRVMPIERD